jgi:hypothetical protein
VLTGSRAFRLVYVDHMVLEGSAVVGRRGEECAAVLTMRGTVSVASV